MLLNIVADAQIELFRPGALRQIVGALRIAGMDIVQIHLAVVQPLAQRTARVRFVHLLPGFPHAEQRARRIRVGLGGLAELVALHADDVGDQHGVVRGHGAARFGDDRRVRQTMLLAGVADGPNYVVGVFVQAVVYRAVGLRAGAFIIDAQTAADVEAVDIDAQLRQLNVEARRFTHAGGDIANIRHLRAEMEMQQLQAVETTRVAHDLHQLQHLRRGKTELRFFAAAGLPFAGALRSQTGTDAETRHHVQTLRLFQHQFHLGHFFNHQVNFVAHFLADQRQADIFTIFIAVADDHRARLASVRQHRHQLRFGSRFQAQRLAGVNQRFDHALMLVDLDRVNQKVVAVIAVRFPRAFKGGVNGA